MKRWIALALTVLILGGLIGWRLRANRAQAAAQSQQRAARSGSAPLVSVAAAARKDIVTTFTSVGSVEAPQKVDIAPKVAGRIEYLQVREGDRVRRGQVLARIDPAEIEAEVREKEAALAETQSRLAQARLGQGPSDVGVRTEIRQQEANLGSMQADYEQVRGNYDAQVASADAAVTDAEGRLGSANAAIANAEAAIRSAQANLANAQTRLNRMDSLYKEGVVAQQEVDDARTVMRVQQGLLDVAEGQLNAARAQRDSASAQKQAAQKQAGIARTKGKADIAAARAKVTQARAAAELARANTAQRPAYQQNLAALQASVDAARASLRAAQSRRTDTALVSPLDGFVTMRYLDTGALATPSQPVLAVQSIRQVWVAISVPEEVSRRIYNGQTAVVAFDALSGRKVTGRVIQINPAADEQSRQFQVRVRLDNPNYLLKPGMFGRVSFTTERVRNTVVVPREAVQQTPDGPTVVVVKADNVVERRPVTTGASDGATIAITNGLAESEKVVTLSGGALKDGQKVRLEGERPRRTARQ